MGQQAEVCQLPSPRPGRIWHRAIDTSLITPKDIAEPGTEQPLDDQKRYRVHARSSVVLVGR